MKSDKKIVTYEQLSGLHDRYRRRQKTTVFTSGCYDLLHIGHLIHFNFCKSKGDILFVSVGNDVCVRELKGPTRPINNERFRARMIAALGVVDHVIISREMGIMDHNQMLALLRPNIYVVPGTDRMLKEKRALVAETGGRLITCRRLPPANLRGGISTTKIIEQL